MDGSEVRQLRKSARMSQTEFGEAIGLSRETISRMERGSEQIDRRTELAMRYISEKSAADGKSVVELRSEVSSILEEATFRGKVSADRIQRLRAISVEWGSAGGSVTGATLIQSAQGVIGMLNTLRSEDGLRASTFADLREVKLAWNSLAIS